MTTRLGVTGTPTAQFPSLRAVPASVVCGVDSASVAGLSQASSADVICSLALSSAIVAVDATEDRPTPGNYGWENLARIERNRRKRELEELADAVELAMVAEGLVEPNPTVAARHVVREYVNNNPPASKRLERAVAYAYRTRTDLAWQLAAREIAKAEEEDDFALLMAIASVA